MNSMDNEQPLTVQQLGNQLKLMRDSSGMSLKTISSRTKINEAYLQAIEDGNLEILPSDFCRRSFVKSYCGLFSADELWQAYSELLVPSATSQISLRVDTSAKKSKDFVKGTGYKHDNSTLILVIAIVLVIAAVCLTFVFSKKISSGLKINQLQNGTAGIIEQKKQKEEAAKKAEEAKAKKLAEERAKAEEDSKNGIKGSPALDEDKIKKLDKNLLYIFAPSEDIFVEVSRGEKQIYKGKLSKGRCLKFKSDNKIPLRVKYENTDKTQVSYGSSGLKSFSTPQDQNVRYYWSDGKVTHTEKIK